jgi:hypothetical protein
MVQPDWAFVFKGGVTAIPIAWGPLFPESRGGESGVRPLVLCRCVNHRENGMNHGSVTYRK